MCNLFLLLEASKKEKYFLKMIFSLNSGTLLLYPEKFVGSARIVFLVGEASLW